MKKITLLHCLAIFTLSTALLSCGKYDDGPKISLASKKSRAANKWKIEALYKNGVPQTISNSEANNTLELTKDGTVYAYDSDLGTTFTGTWEFSSDKEDISATIFVLGTAKNYTFKILRLKKDELWVETADSNGDVFEQHYKPA